MRGKRTRKIVVAYLENMYARLTRYRKLRFAHAIENLSEKEVLAFRKAAHQSARLEASAHEFVAAQFKVFDSISAKIGKPILPMPHHMHGEKAEQRWETRDDRDGFRQSEADLVSSSRRTSPGSEGDVFDPERQQEAYFREERKLVHLSAALRKSEAEILKACPREFSPGFLAMRGAA